MLALLLIEGAFLLKYLIGNTLLTVPRLLQAIAIAAAASLKVRKGPGTGLAPKQRSAAMQVPPRSPGLGSASI